MHWRVVGIIVIILGTITISIVTAQEIDPGIDLGLFKLLRGVLPSFSWEMKNLDLSAVISCSQALETDANGRIYCGTDATGGGGAGLWQVTGEWMSGNASAGGTQKINITDISLEFGGLVSEQNPDAVEAIRLKGTVSDVDVVIGDVTGYFSVWNVADNNAVFYVDNLGNTDIAGDLTTTGNIIVAGTVDGVDVGGLTEDNTSFNETMTRDIFQEDIGADCGAGNYTYGVDNDGILKCREDQNTGGGGITQVNLTAGTYPGNITNGSKTGYDAGNEICDIEYDGYMCTEFDITYFVANYDFSSLTGDAWIIAGGPKYVPADIPVNDCNGWTYGTTPDYLGNYWKFNSTTGGRGAAINCGSSLKLACCQ